MRTSGGGVEDVRIWCALIIAAVGEWPTGGVSRLGGVVTSAAL